LRVVVNAPAELFDQRRSAQASLRLGEEGFACVCPMFSSDAVAYGVNLEQQIVAGDVIGLTRQERVLNLRDGASFVRWLPCSSDAVG
jgi:hypothetical protein